MTDALNHPNNCDLAGNPGRRVVQIAH